MHTVYKTAPPIGAHIRGVGWSAQDKGIIILKIEKNKYTFKDVHNDNKIKQSKLTVDFPEGWLYIKKPICNYPTEEV